MTALRAFDYARLVPELLCTDLARSLSFYVGLCGFRIAYDRPEEGFAYLDLEGAHLMLEEADPTDQGERAWWTARPERRPGVLPSTIGGHIPRREPSARASSRTADRSCRAAG